MGFKMGCILMIQWWFQDGECFQFIVDVIMTSLLLLGLFLRVIYVSQLLDFIIITI